MSEDFPYSKNIDRYQTQNPNPKTNFFSREKPVEKFIDSFPVKASKYIQDLEVRLSIPCLWTISKKSHVGILLSDAWKENMEKKRWERNT